MNQIKKQGYNSNYIKVRGLWASWVIREGNKNSDFSLFICSGPVCPVCRRTSTFFLLWYSLNRAQSIENVEDFFSLTRKLKKVMLPELSNQKPKSLIRPILTRWRIFFMFLITQRMNRFFRC